MARGSFNKQSPGRRALKGLAGIFVTALALGGCAGLQWSSYDKDGVSAFKKGNFEEAEINMKEALKIAEGFGIKDRRLLISLENLGALYHDLEKFQEAEPLLERAIKIREGSADRDKSAELTNDLGLLAQVKLENGHYKEAAALYKTKMIAL